jgi:hypothetical protein
LTANVEREQPMGALESAWDITKEVGLLGAEVGEVAGEDTPLIGSIVNGAEAAYHYGKASDLEDQGDHDGADYQHDKAGYDVLKMIPGVGTVMGVGELANGIYSSATGGTFHDGMENFGDHVMDVGAMAGVGGLGASNPIPLTGGPPQRGDRDDDGDGGNNYHDTWGSHAALRDKNEDRERFAEAQTRADEAKAARAKGGD